MRDASIFFLCLMTTLVTVPSEAQVTYRLEVDNTWSEESHPGAFPTDAHFSWFGGATHNDEVSLWNEGERASPGITQMAEDGSTFLLMDYITFEQERERVGQPLSYRWWFCPEGTNAANCGATTVEFEIDERWPLVTLVSMLGPSPDWFVGVSGLSLRENGRWISKLIVDLRPYDAGTRSANAWALFGPREDPPLPIELITEESGQLVGPDSLGTMTFTLLSPLPGHVPGDCNEDGNFDISDPVCTLEALFTDGPSRLPCDESNVDSAGNLLILDWQSDGSIDLSDAIGMLLYLFADGPPHPLSDGMSTQCTPVEDCGASLCP